MILPWRWKKSTTNSLSKNKPKLLPNSQPGVYQLNCSCNGKYIGVSEKRVLTGCTEHQLDSMNGKWESFGATEHTKECHGQFDWLHSKTVLISPYMYVRKIREALEINKLKTINERTKPSQFWIGTMVITSWQILGNLSSWKWETFKL